MASGQTQYYGLSQWEAADKVERVDFNSDNARVDGALRALAEQAGQKADRSAVDSLSNVVEQKADKTALSAAEGRISDLESGKADKTELAALGAEVHHLSESLCWVRLGSWTLAASASSLDLGSVQDTGRTICTPAAGLYHQCAIRHLTSGPAQQGDGGRLSLPKQSRPRRYPAGRQSGGVQLLSGDGRGGGRVLFPWKRWDGGPGAGLQPGQKQLLGVRKRRPGLWSGV